MRLNETLNPNEHVEQQIEEEGDPKTINENDGFYKCHSYIKQAKAMLHHSIDQPNERNNRTNDEMNEQPTERTNERINIYTFTIHSAIIINEMLQCQLQFMNNIRLVMENVRFSYVVLCVEISFLDFKYARLVFLNSYSAFQFYSNMQNVFVCVEWFV